MTMTTIHMKSNQTMKILWMIEKLTITKKIEDCREYVSMAERSASYGAFNDSSLYWTKAATLAFDLLDNYSHSSFLDDEYTFLKDISKHFTEED